MVENSATNGLTPAPDPIVALATGIQTGMPTNKMPAQHPAQ